MRITPSILMQLPPLLSEPWRELHSLILEEEHWEVLARRMPLYLEGGVPKPFSLPEFHEEVPPPLAVLQAHFQAVYHKSERAGQASEQLLEAWRVAVEQAPFEYLLTVLGQRFTSASLRNHLAIPPLKETLLESAFRPYNRQITVATRAWEKHIGRSSEVFWGEMKGNAKAKNQKVRRLISQMLEEKTWWNAFGHYQFETVYEIRVASGHGIRWKHGGKELIGFLEPFLEDRGDI